MTWPVQRHFFDASRASSSHRGYRRVRLVVDVHPGAVGVGDAVLYRAGDGQLLLGRVAPPPPSAPVDMLDLCQAGHLWIVKERPDAPGADSATLGPIAPEAIAGRITVGLPW